MNIQSVFTVLLIMSNVARATTGFILTNDCGSELTLKVTNSVTLGDKITISCDLHTTTNAQQTFIDMRRANDVGVLVFDKMWKLLPGKVEYPPNPWNGSRDGSAIFVNVGRDGWKRSFDLQQYCDITEPGIYRVMVICPVSKNGTSFECEIASMPAQFVVLPKPASASAK